MFEVDRVIVCSCDKLLLMASDIFIVSNLSHVSVLVVFGGWGSEEDCLILRGIVGVSSRSIRWKCDLGSYVVLLVWFICFGFSGTVGKPHGVVCCVVWCFLFSSVVDTACVSYWSEQYELIMSAKCEIFENSYIVLCWFDTAYT